YVASGIGKFALTLASSRLQFAGGLSHFPASRMPAASRHCGKRNDLVGAALTRNSCSTLRRDLTVA
ncbi:hypothetical protein ALC62_12993, partial [Cyphomyrmex costatus]